MSTAIERVEAQLAHDERSLIQVERADLTELVRLAKLGARVEQCEHMTDGTGPDDDRTVQRVWCDGWNECVAHLREGDA